MTYNLDWRGWPTGWDRSNPFRVVNFLGRTGVNTHQCVYAPNGRTVYLCRRGDTRVLEVRFAGRTAFAHMSPGMSSTAYVDWPERWEARKGEYVPHAWRTIVRQALQITNI